MENITEKPYKVYIRVDVDNRVVSINSSAFMELPDAPGWVEIDSGFGYNFHHAQGNYLPGPLTDRRGLYMYKLVDGRIVPRTAEEVEADYIPPVQVPTVDDRLKIIETAIDKIKKLFGGAWND